MAENTYKVIQEIAAQIDEGSFDKAYQYARDTGKKIDSALVAKYVVDIAALQGTLSIARAELAQFKASGDKQLQLQAQINVNTISDQLTNLKGKFSNLTKTGDENISRLQAKFDSLGASIGKAGDKIKGIFSSGLGALGIGASIGAIAQQTLQITTIVQNARIAFEQLFDSDTSKRLVDQLKELAKTSTFSFDSLVEGAKRLAAFGFEATQVVPVMQTVQEAVAALGGKDPSGTFQGIVTALGQIQTKGHLVQQEVNQLAERGIPVYEILREKLKLTADQMANIGKAGISSGEAVKAILEGIQERFGGTIEKQANTVGGALTRLRNTFALTLSEIGESSGTKFVEFINGITTFVAQYGAKIASTVTDVVSTIGSILTKAFQGIQLLVNTIIGGLTSIGAQSQDTASTSIGAFEAFLYGITVINQALKGTILLLKNIGAIAADILGASFNVAKVVGKQALSTATFGIVKGPDSQDFGTLKGSLTNLGDSFVQLTKDFSEFGDETGLVFKGLQDDINKTGKVSEAFKMPNIDALGIDTNGEDTSKAKKGPTASELAEKEAKKQEKILIDSENRRYSYLVRAILQKKGLTVQAYNDIERLTKEHEEKINRIKQDDSKNLLDDIKAIRDGAKELDGVFEDVLATISDDVDKSKKKLDELDNKIKDIKNNIKDYDNELIARGVDIAVRLKELDKKQFSGEGFTESEQEEFRRLKKEQELNTSVTDSAALTAAIEKGPISETEKILAKKKEDELELKNIEDLRAAQATLYTDLLVLQKQASDDYHNTVITNLASEITKTKELTAVTKELIALQRTANVISSIPAGSPANDIQGQIGDSVTNANNITINFNGIKTQEDQDAATKVIKDALKKNSRGID